MNQEKYIGMDVHAATISAAGKNAEGKLLMECVLETDIAQEKNLQDALSHQHVKIFSGDLCKSSLANRYGIDDQITSSAIAATPIVE